MQKYEPQPRERFPSGSSLLRLYKFTWLTILLNDWLVCFFTYLAATCSMENKQVLLSLVSKHSYWKWPSRNCGFSHEYHGDVPVRLVNVYQKLSLFARRHVLLSIPSYCPENVWPWPPRTEFGWTYVGKIWPIQHWSNTNMVKLPNLAMTSIAIEDGHV